tara:strand:- start:162 stop:1397 length:1236 start_codon:yes stop_codon:yes gene_type:complete
MSNNVVAPTFDVTSEELIRRAEGLRELIRAQAQEAEALGHYTDDVHEALLAQGFYHVLTPKRYGGLELDVATFAKLAVEISRGDPGSGWCYVLGHGHALTTAALWSQSAQDEVFTTPAGYFRASHSLQPGGTARKVDGGYIVNGVSPYQSGVPYSTHATLSVILEGEDRGGFPAFLQVLVPEGQFEIVDDWGGDAIIGMRASGSNSVRVAEQFIPEHYAIELDWLGELEKSTSPGAVLHDNPMYLGVAQTFLQTELVAVIVGAARAALDEYEVLSRTKASALPPRAPRIEDPGHQHDFGAAKARTDSAEAILLHVAHRYAEQNEAAVRGGIPFTRKADVENYGMLLQAGELASQAVEILFRSAGSSAAKKGARIERYYRDVSMYRTHTSSQYDALAQRIGAVNFDVITSVF